MECQKIANLIDDTPNQPSKFRTRNWVEINDESRGTYNVNSQIKFKTAMLKCSLCDYSDGYILVKGTISVNDTVAGDAINNNNRKVIFKNCAPCTNCISEINNTQIDNAKDINIVIPMYNLIEYSDNYAKKKQEVYGNIAKIYQLEIIIMKLLFLRKTILLIHSILKQKSQAKLETMEQKMLK